MVWRLERFGYLGSENTSPVGPDKNISSPYLFHLGVFYTQGIQAGTQCYLMRGLLGGFTFSLQEFTCAIGVSA